MISVTTSSGSIYLIDEANKKILRMGLAGKTKRATDAWKKYESVVFKQGSCMIITWGKDVPLLEGSPKDAKPLTITSEVVKNEEVEYA